MNNVKAAKKFFEDWNAAKHWGMHLTTVETGRAVTTTKIHSAMLTPHESPVLLGMMGAVLANNTGVAALRTIAGNVMEPMLPKAPEGNFYESIVPEEEYVLVEARVVHDREWLDDETKKPRRQVTVIAEIRNMRRVLKGRLTFIYNLMPASKIIEKNSRIREKYLK